MAAIRARLGPDVLDAGADVEAVRQRVLRSRAPIGTLLMDQSVMSGIGNAYRSELLYRQRLHPLVPGRELDAATFDRLWADAVALMRIGVQHGPILCVEPGAVGKRNWRELTADERFWVYRREACRGCGGRVEHLTLAGRRVDLCPREQVRG